MMQRIIIIINKLSTRHSEKLRKKKDQTFTALRKKNGNLQLQHEIIINPAGVTLTQVLKDILCSGLKFGIPLKIIKNH